MGSESCQKSQMGSLSQPCSQAASAQNHWMIFVFPQCPDDKDSQRGLVKTKILRAPTQPHEMRMSREEAGNLCICSEDSPPLGVPGEMLPMSSALRWPLPR